VQVNGDGRLPLGNDFAQLGKLFHGRHFATDAGSDLAEDANFSNRPNAQA
jgi:hypothetical protein